jgi:hypothetical protein
MCAYCFPTPRFARSNLTLAVVDQLIPGAFQLYDIDKDGTITYDEMLQIVQSIYKMTGEMVKLPSDEDTPEKVRRLITVFPISPRRQGVRQCRFSINVNAHSVPPCCV